ncbi:MARTX multifunctional-autoprocessing repeats-in-toxin holotoxin RtxA [Xenorhabdus miraniensis]|uniref:Autotransporter adhesin n=1 Tax=Xenorhabdus miraniensis TaxID=351674 RepID=A0A2D0JPF4_9GAMM|nr:MARTX multifunctional-autoprocessing repeats-in-toxin holotoxin RtxA [Xenorhabdus miraniensis]PHM48203.1 Autotransporter adhesin [Xenorhabdus miraniensis]
MGKPFWRSVEYFVTGNYFADDGDNDIVAIGFGGNIYAYGGDDHIKLGSIGATVYTGTGHDIVEAGAAYLKVNDTTGNLTVKGGAGYAEINKSDNGSINFAGVAGGVSIAHTGNYGDITYAGGAAYNGLIRKGLKGNIRFDGAGGYNTLWHETNQGNLSFNGAGAGNVIDRTWFDKYQGSQGDVTFKGAGAANVISSRVETGNIDFTGGGAYNHLSRKGKVGNITLKGAAAYNRIERTRQADDVYSETRGDIRFEGGGGYNSLYSDVAHGNIYFTGAGAYNEITRKGSANDFGSEGMEYAKAEEVVLTNATMNGSWIGHDHRVTGLKSTQEPNTYLFAFEDGTHTKINKVQLRNDPETGKLRYFSTAWYKEGKHLKGLEKQDISDQSGFNSVDTDGAYTLSNLTVEQRKQITVYAVEKKLTENEWVNYGNGVQIDAADITLSDAKMGGYAIYRDGTTVDVKAVKSNRMPNTYIYGKQLGEYTKVVVVELRNDPKTGILQYIARPWYKEGNHTANLANEDISSANGYHYMGTGSYSLSDLHYSVNAVRTTSGRVPDTHEYSELDLFKSATGSGDSSGDIHYAGAGGGNIIKSNVTRGNVYFYGAGGANVIEHSSELGNTEFRGAGGANILTRKGKGNVQAVIGGGVNVLTHIGDGKTTGIMLGGANILTKKGKGNVQAIMGGGANVLTHVGDGKTTGIMLGGANILTKVGDGDTTGIMLGLGNALTHVGDGQTLGIMGAAGNIFTKVGDGTTIAAMVGVGNIFTHVGMGNAWALMGGAGNIFTKVGNGDALALMLAFGNIYTHIGNGTSVALMIAKGNIATKVGNGDALSAMIGKGNIFTQIGHGSTFAAMIGGANVLTKVGDDLTAALMVGKANIYTHVGKGTSIGLFAGTANIMTKVGDGTTLSAMFGKANIMTHVGNGLTGVLALGKANIVTKVGNDFMGVVAAAEANVMTHVGDGTTAALLAGKGNILTKVGEGTTVGLLISKIGNIMTHVGDGTTVGFAKGEANIITKVGDGLGINAVWGKANIMTHAGDGDRYNFAKGDANIITKVGDGQEVTVVQGEANILTHVGDGDDYTGAWGKANVITKVGDGRNVVLAKGDVNLVTQIGDGDSFNALWSQGNVVTKIGDGMQVTAAKGKGNITTTVGDGLSVTAVHGDLNVNTKVGDGVSVNVAWGKLNVNTRVGDGLNVSVMKGKGNASIRVGDGLNINASYARNNVAIQVGNGDFYSLAVAESNTQSNKLDALFDNVKQTLLGHAGSQGISYLVNGDEANTSGTHQGRGAINLPEVSSLNGFKLTEIDEVTSDLQGSLKASVTGVDTPDMEGIQNSLDSDRRITSSQPRNLIVNGDFEQGATGWKSTNGIEANHSAQAYGLSVEGHGHIVSELDVSGNTHIYQDIQDLAADEEITVQFDFARRAGCSDDNGLEVWWNGEVVFAAANGNVKWQNKALTLKAKAGSNRLAFSGIGLNDGLGYVLDNVSAISLPGKSDKIIAEHMQQDKASQNALQDKERAEADKQRLTQEKDKQLAAIAGTQAQLETTDLDALNANGQAQRDAIKDEAQAVTDELMAKARGLEALDSHNTYHGESGQQWHDQFAGGLLDRVQTELDKASETARNQLDHSQKAATARLGDIKVAIAKSEVGVLKAEQNRQHAKQDVEEARIQAKGRENEAIRYQQQAERDGKSSKLDDNYQPTRTGVTGSDLSGKTDESNYSEDIEKVEKSKSHINPESTVQADGGFSEELQYLGEDLNELGSLREVLAHLPVNAGVRTRKASGGSTLTPVHTETPVSQPVSQSTDTVTEWVRNTPKISGLDLSGLKALGEEHALPKMVDISETVSATVSRAQKVADIYRWLDSDNNLATEKYIPMPGFARVDTDIPDNVRQKMVAFVEDYLNGTGNSVPKDRITSLAKLFVDATIDYDWDKRVEFVSRLESYGYSFEPVNGDKSIVSFWSGRDFQQYRAVLDAAQTDGKKVVYDTDVKGNVFAIELNKTLMRWGRVFLDYDIAEEKALQSAINASANSNTGFWSSLYAAQSRDDVYVIAEGGLRFGNYFWNVELPVLRQLQREGWVGEIRLLDKAANEYQGLSPESIGRRLTEAGVSVKARFDSLSLAEQEKLLVLDPDKYRPDTLVNLDIKTSAIDSLLNQALPFYGLRTERNLLVRESDDDESFEVRPWPDSNSDDFKTIMVEDPDDSAQIKAVERFILANYDNYDQLPGELYLAEDRIISHDQRRTRILAEKVDGSWNYKPKTDLMSAAELQDAAYVKGKIRGDSYKNVLDALKSYENLLQSREDYNLESVEKLTHLRHQVEGYLLGHPDSERTQALKNLLSQINVRMEESLVLAEPTLESAGKGSFSDLYSKLSNANLKDSKHLYIDEQGNFVTRGKSNIQIAMKAESAETAVEQIKAAVSREYGQSVAENVFATLQSRDLSKDGKGIDVSGLRKIHQAIEQQLSPVSATLFVWKPSDHSRLGHAALQIGQGRIQLNAEDAGEFNEKNYVSWWPKGSKSSDLSRIFNVASERYPDLRIRWRDLSQPAAQNGGLEQDVASEENDHFGLRDGTYKLEKFIEKLQIAKGVDAKFAEVSEAFAMAALANPHLLQSAGVPEHISQPFIQQWEEGGTDMFEIGRDFAEALRAAAKQQSPELAEKRIANVIRQFAEHELNNIRDFKTSEGDEGRVFRINLAGLDAAAMQAEWHKISQNPDARYQLLTDNCSSTVAKVLKAGGADKVIGHTWRPKFGVWTPTELFNFAQALQEAQVEKIAKKPNRIVDEDLAALGHSDNKEKMLEKVAIDNDGTPPRDRDPFNPLVRFLNDELYGEKEDRRQVHSSTQIILDAATTDGTADKVTLQGDAGRLTGYYHNAAQKSQDEQNTAKKVVLFIHGSGSSAEEQASAMQDNYKKQGVDMLAVNMRGYGSSDGHPSEKGLYQDARTMFRYLVNDRGIKPENIIIHGYSMGGAVAADLARYAERNGQSVSGLLLDRPMPSMTKAITAHEVPNPAGLTGILAKAVNGQFSVEKNLQGISKQTPIMLLTDSEGLGDAGERMRAKLIVAGYQVSGEHTFYGHEASGRLMNQYAEQIVSTLSEPQRENGRVKAGLLENMIYTLFDAKSGRKELDQYSFHFTQGSSLLSNLDKLVPEIGNVLLTNGNHVESKEFLEGVCFALSARYLIEERVHGLGGGKAYLSWLTDAVKAYNDNSVNKKSDIHSVETSLLNQYRRQNIGPAIQDLLSMQYSQTQDMSGSLSMRRKANQAYGGKLKANGLTGNRIDQSLSNDIAGYESVMEKLRDVDKTTYMSFMSEDHAMAVVVHKGENQTIWSFYDPNFGIKSFDNYKNFERFMDSFHKGIMTGYKSKLGYTYETSMENNQSFNVNYNTFEKGTITQYDGVWQQARAGEQQYVLRALKEQGKTFKLSSNVTGRVVDYRDDAVTLEVTTKKGEKVLVEVESNNFKQAANLVQSNIDKVIANSVNGKFTLNVSTAIDTSDGMKKPLGDDALESHVQVNNQDVNSWENIVVKPQSEGSDSRFSGQIIIQTENDPVAAKAAASLASKHPDSSVIVQLDANGQYRVVYGDVEQLPSGKLRWQIVGHGRDENDITQKNTRISGYSADELALKLKKFSADFKQTGTPDHISLVGCSLIGDDKREGFARRFISALDSQGIRITVSARSSDVAVDSVGRKYTKDAQDQWVHKLTDNKIVLGWNDKGEVESHSERVRRGISENDIVLSRVGQTDVGAKAQGAIADNAEIFHAPKQRDAVDNHSAAASSNNQLSYSGNIQLQVGDGEFTAVNWGTTNVGIKVGTGGFKSLAFGDNNVMVHIGNGDSKHSVDIAGYQALEGAQLFVGNRNVSFNAGRSNDLIVMLEKSIPTPPLVNPFDGASRISGVLQDIAGSFNSPDWLAKQNQQWTLESAKKYVSDLSGLDLTSSVDYSTLIDLDSQNERSSRGLKSDLESTLNKKYNQWLGGNGNTPEMGKTNRAEKFRRVNEKLVFNFAVGGQGADIQVTTGNWNFMFGDNIQSILDTNLGSLFGLMTQEYTSTGMAKTTFTFSPTDLPRQIKNKLLGNLAGVSADTTLADIFGVDYTSNGGIVSRSNEPVNGVAILREMLEIIGEFSGDQLKAFTDRDKLLDSLKAGLKMGADGVKSFAESHGLKAKAPDENQEGLVTIDVSDKSAAETKAPQADRAFGLTSLNLPNLFATLFNQDKQAEMESLVANLKENLTADLLNMQDKTFDFLRNSGHLQGDGDIHVSLGNYNFNWGGDGKDLGAYLGDNNNFWGGRGDDVFYSVGTSNIFAGGAGNNTGVMMGRENMMFGGAGNDVAVLAGRINYAYMGAGDDQVFVFGEGGMVEGGKGRDYIVASGNFNRIDAGEDQDYVVTIGNNNQADLGEGNDFATVFGNYNRIDGNAGNNSIRLMGYHAVINGGTGNDHLIADAVSKFSQINGGAGDDLLVLGGYQNHFKGGMGVNRFVVSGSVIDNVVEDIKQGDKIIFNDINWQNLWFQRSGYDLVLLTHRNVKDTSAQGQFEAMGSVTFNNYFNGNRADIVTQMGDKDAQGEREYTALSANAVDSLVQAMSGFAPNMGDSGFFDSLDNQTKSTIITAWSDTTNGKSKLV